MRVTYLNMFPPDISGGTTIVMLHVENLRRLGHDVRVLATEPAPEWTPFPMPWKTCAREEVPLALSGADAVVTGFHGVHPALSADVSVVAHLCAGYEKRLWPALARDIEAVYRKPTVKMVIAPHLQRLLKADLGVDSVMVGTPIELSWFSDGGTPARSARALRVLSVGADPEGVLGAPVPFKGIKFVLEVIRRARRRGNEVELVRLAPRPDAMVDSELVGECHVAVPPKQAPSIYRSCDVYLSGSTADEGLGMPAIEAAVAGLASVLPAIPSFSEIPELRETALFYPPGDVDAAVDQLARLESDPGLRRRLSSAEAPRRALVRRFDPLDAARRVAASLESAMRR